MSDVNMIKVNFESKLVYLPLLRKAIRGICSCVIENEQFLQDIDLSLNEAVANVICHAYHNEPGHEIQVSVSLYPTEVELQIVDVGVNYHGLGIKPSSELTIDSTDINSLSETGRGIFIIHQLMDSVDYTSGDGKNVLILRKSFK